ncbi:MAG: alkaline phosphatase family protein [Chloroflexota bacterium]
MRQLSHNFILALALLFAACTAPASPTPIPSSTATLPPPATVTNTFVAAHTPSGPDLPAGTPLPDDSPTPRPTVTVPPTATPVPKARRVVVVSFDGLRPDAILNTPMQNLMALMDRGAFSLQAQTTYPSATLPSHASMLTGLCPAGHGVDWNDYIPQKGYAQATDLFDLAHAAGLQTVMYVGKQKLRQITEPESTDVYRFIADRDLVIVEQLLADFPQDFGLLFVHFPTADWMGHRYGWLSPQQFSVLEQGDEALGMLLAHLDALGLREETLVIVTADHGGHGVLHGSRLPEDMTIPWVAAGPGVKQGGLMAPVYTMDTAATAAWALDLPLPPEWDGVPVMEAFGQPPIERPAEVCP